MDKDNRNSMSRRRFLKNCLATLLGCGALGNVSWASQFLNEEHSKEHHGNPQSDFGIMLGPTPIVGGRAVHKRDFTLYNGRIAASFAVGSIGNWKMTKGSILDIAVMKNEKFGNNLLDDVEFLHHLWITLGSYNGEDVFSNPIGEVAWNRYADKIVVMTKSPYWTWTCGQVQPLDMVIKYTLGFGENHIGVEITVKNPINNQPYNGLIHPKEYNFPDHSPRLLKARHGKQVLLDSEQKIVSVRLDGVAGSCGCRDATILRSIKPGRTRVFKGEILVDDHGGTGIVV